jgi:hypothetical protein
LGSIGAVSVLEEVLDGHRTFVHTTGPIDPGEVTGLRQGTVWYQLPKKQIHWVRSI